MQKQELYEAVEMWNTVYKQRKDLINSTDFEHWSTGMMRVASVLSVSTELKGTPAEAFLNRAITFASEKEAGKIDVVFELLRETQKYLEEMN